MEEKIGRLCRERGYGTMHDMEFLAANAFLMFLYTLAVAQFSKALMHRASERFRGLEHYHKRNCVAYVVEIMACTMVLILQIIHGWDLLLYGSNLSEDNRIGLCYAALILCTVYAFEIIYRVKIRFPLAFHHLLFMSVILLSFLNWQDYRETSKPVVRMCLMFLTHSSTEQLCFIALLSHRILPHEEFSGWIESLHFWSAITSYTVKTSVFCIVWIFWLPVAFPAQPNEYTVLWKYVFPLFNVMMLCTQWWESNVFYVLSRRFKLHSLTKAGTGGVSVEKHSNLVHKVRTYSACVRNSSRHHYISATAFRVNANNTTSNGKVDSGTSLLDVNLEGGNGGSSRLQQLQHMQNAGTGRPALYSTH